MIITHNMQAMATNRIVNNNINAHAKSTSKISSGQRINRAVDNPVGLAISETMRKQIRGLMQGINNTKDGIGFVQVADGAMDEVHAMLQRMNELAIKAAHGLCTEEDRAALNAEFDQLRTEIDRIDNTTTFNTIPVFDKHEASYYQICGNRQWDDNQLHTITSSNNELNIHLPDGYEPKDYTLTVPAGTYTTQELIDEIDTALSKMDPPNPGFVFELTSDGYCNLNFENAEGKPTKIEMVDGGLSYLIYDFQTGGSPASLLGTSPFKFNESGQPRLLEIVKGQNDELGFYAESGEGVKYISITLDQGYYNREQIIDHINEKLEQEPNAKGIVAKEYGDFYVQITGGDTVNITGLKGNMFKIENPKKGENIYTSVFYDNVLYGSSHKTNAQITGKTHTYKIKIYENSANQNNVLRFKLSDDANAQFKEIPLPTGEFTAKELSDEINKFLSRPENKDLADEIEVTYSGSAIKLANKNYGSHSKLIFDTSNSVYTKAYETLFLSTSASPDIDVEEIASATGTVSFDPSASITLKDNATLSFRVDNSPYPYTIPSSILKGQHTNLQSLANELTNYINNSTNLAGKVKFDVDSENHLVLHSLPGAGVKDISLNINETAKYLFQTTGLISAGTYTNASVKVDEKQGEPGSYNVEPASVSITAGPCKLPVEIKDDNNQICLNLRNAYSSSSSQTITLNLASGTYSSMGQITTHINNLLRGLGGDYSQYIQASYDSSTLKFTITPPKDNTSGFKMPAGRWDISFSSSSALTAMMGKTEGTSGPTYHKGETAAITSRYPITNSIELSDQCNNNQLRLYLNDTPYDLKINGIFNNRADLLNAVKAALSASPLNGRVEATLIGDCIRLTSKDPTVSTLTGEGTFYTEVICKGVQSYSSLVQGTFNYEPTRVIGRKDLTKEPIRITAGLNDTLTFDFTRSYNGNKVPTTISVTIPEGVYQNGYELVNTLNDVIKKQLEDDSYFGKDGDFDLAFSIGGGGDNIPEVEGSIDDLALHIAVNNKPGKEPDNGQYIIDGVRGNAACYVFYKTASLPSPTYIVGTKDIRDGITFEPGKNVLTLSANSIPYKYTFEENKFYTADEFINELNKRFEKGDDNGNSAPLRATLEDGAVKIWHKNPGANTITDIGGSARSTIFFEEEGRDDRDPLVIQVGAEQRSTIELPRIRVDSASLSINSITLSKAKYADKAIERIKGAIKELSDRRSTYGAMQNRLEHTVNNNENVTEQVQAGESRIRDTDMSSELIRYSNLNILLKAGHKMIAYSNNNIKKLLTILE